MRRETCAEMKTARQANTYLVDNSKKDWLVCSRRDLLEREQVRELRWQGGNDNIKQEM